MTPNDVAHVPIKKKTVSSRIEYTRVEVTWVENLIIKNPQNIYTTSDL